MAGSSEPVENPKLGVTATIAGLIFALSVLGGFGISTAVAVDLDDDHGEEHSEDTDSHGDDEHGEEEHSDEGE